MDSLFLASFWIHIALSCCFLFCFGFTWLDNLSFYISLSLSLSLYLYLYLSLP